MTLKRADSSPNDADTSGTSARPEDRCDWRSAKRGACREKATRKIEWRPATRFVGRFCERHWSDREEFRPAAAEAFAATQLKINQLLAGTHRLVQACRECGVIQGAGLKICDGCGGFDLAPETEAA